MHTVFYIFSLNNTPIVLQIVSDLSISNNSFYKITKKNVIKYVQIIYKKYINQITQLKIYQWKKMYRKKYFKIEKCCHIIKIKHYL